jgi:SAM-dependent methyltransferase
MKINTNRWNRIRYTLFAPLYDRVASFAAQRRRSLELLALERGERVLLVSAGTGADLPFIPEGVEVVAGDIAPAMVERIAGARHGAAGRADVMDGQALPLPVRCSDRSVASIFGARRAVGGSRAPWYAGSAKAISYPFRRGPDEAGAAGSLAQGGKRVRSRATTPDDIVLASRLRRRDGTGAWRRRRTRGAVEGM